MGSDSQGFQGALGGGMTGAGLGSAIMPGIGTAIGGGLGAVLGGLGGLFGDSGQSQYQDQLKRLAAYYQHRTGPQAGPASQGAYSGFRQNQAGLIAQLEAMARGDGPSAAALQMREGMDKATAAQTSAATGAGGRGVNSGAALRNATNNSAAIMSQGNRDMGTLRAQEQANAVGMLGQVIGQGRSADEGMNQFNAGQQNNMSQANLSAQMQAMGINTQAQLQALMAAMGAAGPGMGTQLLAGGASMFPGMMQMNHSGGGGVPQQGGGGFGNYQRNPDGGQGPVTSPSQMG